MDEKIIAKNFSLIEETARSGRELVSKIFISERETNKNNVNFSQYEILETIANNPNITQNDLCTTLCKNKVYMSKCLGLFEKKKYITRNFLNKNDKVLTGYTITERGLISVRVGSITLNELDRKIISKLKEDEIENTTLYLNNLKDVVAKLITNLDIIQPMPEENNEEDI